MQALSPLATELNKQIREFVPSVYPLLSELGKRIYLPQGILRQSAEANEKAYHSNATRAVAYENNKIMHLDVSRKYVPEIPPDSIFGYPPVLGNSELRKLWQTHIRTGNPLLKDAPLSKPIVTCGITHSFSLLADMFVNLGDTLILPDMTWGNYRLIFQTKVGADIHTYPFFDSDKHFNISAFKETLCQIGTDKLLILLNFPHNPTGYAITRDEAQHILDTIIECAETGCHILVMVDDAYTGFWYDSEVMQESIFGMLVNCHSNVVPVKIDGATKEEYAWGLRVGFLTFGFPEHLIHGIEGKLSGLIRANTSGATQVSQTLILEAMQSPEYTEQKQHNYETLKARALKVKEVTTDVRYANLWEVYPSHAGYFTCLSIKSGNAEEVRQILLNEYGIGTIALSDTELRVAYSCLNVSDIEEVFKKIAQVIQSYL
ncbi:MAG: aminotransferase class I/II-fold pyridoxal phosphate-dependent enzyme [Candidatus Poribacteria bacterium]|nr:aminotransferase class I/II-fold pyridoxal phosphate-dependent enzyme [Candidatus Poribacteria bacterium]